MGCETALHLAEQGRKVTVVEMLPEVVTDAIPIKAVLTARLIDNGVEILTGVKVTEITDGGVTALDLNQNVVNMEGDRVVLAAGLIPQAGLYEELKRQGKIRAIGVSNFGASYLEELASLGRAETNQVCYSLLWRPIEHEVAPVCMEHDIGILCYSPLCQGLLTGKFASADDVPQGRARTRLFSKHRPQARHDEPGCEAETFEAIARLRRIAEGAGQPMGRMALAWLLAQPGVTSVVAGARSVRQVAENAVAADLHLGTSTLAALSAATETVKARIGTNADMWQTESRMERG